MAPPRLRVWPPASGQSTRVDYRLENILCHFDELAKTSVNRRFRRRRAALRRELAQGERGVAEAKLRDIGEGRGQIAEHTCLAEAAHGDDLLVRGAPGADEVRLVGVREAVRAALRRGDDGVLVERQDGVARAGVCEHVGDGLGALRVRDGVPAAVDHGERRKGREELRALERGRPDLEMRGPRPAERAAAEQRSAQVRTAAARSADDPFRRPFGGARACPQDSRFGEHVEGNGVSLDVHLVPRRAVERTPPVGPDLGADAERAEEAECTARYAGAREVEVNADPPAAEEVDAPRRVREARELGEPVAVALGCDRGELVAQVLRARHPRAPACAACTRGRASRTGRARPRRRSGGTGRRPPNGCARRRCRPHVALPGVPPAPRPRRTSQARRRGSSASRGRRRSGKASRRRGRARRRGTRRARLRSTHPACRRVGTVPFRGQSPNEPAGAPSGATGRRRARSRPRPNRRPRSGSLPYLQSCPMSAPGLFRPPAPQNEPVKDYVPGSPERVALQQRLQEMRTERLDIPLVIGGEDVRTGETREAVMPHDKDHVLADVHQGGAAEVERAIAAAGDAWEDWHRTPWEDRAAVFLRAADLLAGPWRSTLNAATMLGQSKTAHQAEIDAACELVDFWRWNVEFMLRIYSEQPVSSAGVWNRMEYRPLEGFVFAVTPFNFTAIAGNLPGSAALMGNTVVWKPATTAMLSAYWLMRLLQEAGLPPGVINLVYGSGPEIGDAALASEHLAGIHFTGSTPVFNSMWQTIGSNIAEGRYRNYPRIVGETGGQDFIVAHPSPNG